MESVSAISADQLMNAIGVVLVLFGSMVTVDKVIDIFKKWRSPNTDTAKKLASDKLRLDTHDREIHALQDGNQVLCAGVLALLDHELHNGNSDQMQRARDDIMGYLQKRITE